MRLRNLALLLPVSTALAGVAALPAAASTTPSGKALLGQAERTLAAAPSVTLVGKADGQTLEAVLATGHRADVTVVEGAKHVKIRRLGADVYLNGNRAALGKDYDATQGKWLHLKASDPLAAALKGVDDLHTFAYGLGDGAKPSSVAATTVDGVDAWSVTDSTDGSHLLLRRADARPLEITSKRGTVELRFTGYGAAVHISRPAKKNTIAISTTAGAAPDPTFVG